VEKEAARRRDPRPVMLDRLEPGEQFARHPGAVDLHLVMVRVSPQLNRRSASASTLTTSYTSPQYTSLSASAASKKASS